MTMANKKNISWCWKSYTIYCKGSCEQTKQQQNRSSLLFYLWFSQKCSSTFRSSSKDFLIHANTSYVLVPIIKDKMGDMCSSKNYRSIAISSLILKIIDWVIIILFGEYLSLDDLQFSYKSGCSTTVCTWLAIETIDHFFEKWWWSVFLHDGHDKAIQYGTT